MARTTSRSSKIRLYTERLPKVSRSPIEMIGSLPEVLRAFERTTGWSLQYAAGPEPKTTEAAWSAPVSLSDGAKPGHFRLSAVEPTVPVSGAPTQTTNPQSNTADHPRRRATRKPAVDLPTARAMASSLADLLGEFMEVRRALQYREAELAAGVPVVPHSREQQHLALTLESVLRGGAEAVGAEAAAIYLLDEATSELKLRSCWNLPLDRLTAPARPLQGAVADLEALLGHAVVLQDTLLMQHWRVPEDFAAAVCVPISSPTTIFGTMWVFAGHPRDFDEQQTNLLEIVAGRIASDLEREMLLREGVVAAEVKAQLHAAERLQRGQLPTIAPMLEGWDMAGWTAQAGPVGGDFHDWFCLPDGLLAIALGHSMDQGLEAALSAAALKAALRAHGQYYREAQQTLKRLNLTLWTGSAGDQYASLFYALIETATGRVCTAAAGQPSVLRLGPNGCESLTRSSARLGESPESEYEQFGYELQPGEALILFTEGVRDAACADGLPLGESGVGELLAGRLDLSAAEMIMMLRSRLESLPTAERHDRSILVVKRRRV